MALESQDERLRLGPTQGERGRGTSSFVNTVSPSDRFRQPRRLLRVVFTAIYGTKSVYRGKVVCSLG